MNHLWSLKQAFQCLKSTYVHLWTCFLANLVFACWKSFLILGRILLNYDVMITGEKYSIIYGGSVESGIFATVGISHFSVWQRPFFWPETRSMSLATVPRNRPKCVIPTPTSVIGASHKHPERKALGNPAQVVWWFDKLSEKNGSVLAIRWIIFLQILGSLPLLPLDLSSWATNLIFHTQTHNLDILTGFHGCSESQTLIYTSKSPSIWLISVRVWGTTRLGSLSLNHCKYS